jgi:YHS domain-containing protein
MHCEICGKRVSKHSFEYRFGLFVGEKWFCSKKCLTKFNEREARIRERRRKEAQIAKTQKPLYQFLDMG